MFKLDPFPHSYIPKVIQTTKGRYYDTPNGMFPSVTNVLSAYQDKRYLIKWREKIGDDAANQIIEQARFRGNSIHKMAEMYLQNKPNWNENQSTINIETFRQIQGLLDTNVNLVRACELPLWSRDLKIAGTADAIVNWSGHNTILDFKTSKKHVGDNSDKLRFYKMQTVIYAMMVNERYNFDCEYSIILITIDHHNPKVVYFRNTAFREIAADLIRKVTLDIPIKS